METYEAFTERLAKEIADLVKEGRYRKASRRTVELLAALLTWEEQPGQPKPQEK